jgi:hypothetical protein
VGAISGWAAGSPSTLFIVDEAYLEFARVPSVLDLGLPNVVVLRSMTKDYALAGLRLGYLAGPADVVAAVARVRPPWNVSAPAQAAGVAALADDAHFRLTMCALRRAREGLVAGLRASAWAPYPRRRTFSWSRWVTGPSFVVRYWAGGYWCEMPPPSASGSTCASPRAHPRRTNGFWPPLVSSAARCRWSLRRALHRLRGRITMPGRALMVQGTSSSAGKSLLAAALCRLFARRGYRVAPFKAQNMSNNAAVCPDGSEIGRAQAVQAAACGLEPSAVMTPSSSSRRPTPARRSSSWAGRGGS